ncbi:hypothetical protein GCM10009836_20470 [Pseudonocardia ailaonensis]|uniref:PASTA domain-containing protein n=1 Tax=Pseudonocardia ailaonensis TaxID=367279 RepID=A0ABN2MWJ1_9PSEU
MTEPLTETGMVPADYHAFWLVDRSSPAGIGEGVIPANGLVEQSVPGAVVVQTGVASGEVSVTVEVRDAAPASPDVGDWDEVAEFQ